MRNAQKKVITPKSGNYQVKLVTSTIIKNSVFKPVDNGILDVITRFCNHLDEQIVIINEYEEVLVIKNNPNKSYKEFEIVFNHSKLPIANKQDYEDCSISLTMEDFKRDGCVYISELNIVVALARANETYTIRHPFSNYKHRDVLKATIEQFKEELTNIAILWYINEPDRSNETFYLNIGEDVVPLHKTHHPDNQTSFVIISPESQNPSDMDYDTQIFNITSIKNEEVREISYRFGKNTSVLYISKSLNQLYKEIEKRRKEKKSFVGKMEYEEEIAALKREYELKLSEELQKLEYGKDGVILTLEEKIEYLNKTIKALEDQLQSYKEINDMYDDYHKRESNRFTSSARVHTAKTNAKKEKMQLFNDLIKYGIGGLITLVTLLTAQKIKGK